MVNSQVADDEMINGSSQVKESTSNAFVQSAFQNNQSPSLNRRDKSIKGHNKVSLKSQIKEAWEKVDYWRKNIFELSKGQYGKEFIREITEWINRWCNNTDIAFDAIFVMPNLLLQRTNFKAKGKENKETLKEGY